MRLVTLLCGALLIAGAVPGSVASPTVASAAAAECPPEIIELPAPPRATGTALGQMNNTGWVVGYAEVDDEWRLTLWRDGRAPLDLGSTDRTLDNGNGQYRDPVDINDNGVIAFQQGTYKTYRYQQIGMSSLLWDDGTTTRLKGTAKRPWAWVTAVNDRGLAVGYITDTRRYHGVVVPVVWRNGRPERLPLPARVTRKDSAGGFAADINNRGLVVGNIGGSKSGTYNAYWWRLGGGHGELRAFGDYTIKEGRLVDNRGGMVGWRPNQVLWSGPTARPRDPLVPFEISAISGDGEYVVGREQEDRGGEQDNHAQIGTTTGPPRSAMLPYLPDLEDAGSPDVGTGVTAYAPQGGVTVGATQTGEVEGEYVQTAVLWTCAQTYVE